VFLRTLSRGALAALLLTAVPMMVPASASAATPAAGMAVPANFGSAVYPRAGRYVLVDAASARLFMVEDGMIRDSMRVIVGKPATQTPTLASAIHYATINPYWNVPADLTRTLIAPNVLKQGTAYLRERHYQVLESFAADAAEISPDDVDWQAVADGRAAVRVRQLPGPANSMGQVKFGFPNNDGIYLHDTPKKELFDASQRNISNGCVRLEDAPRLARWLLGRDPGEIVTASAPEQHVLLPRAVPIFITYLNEPANAASMALAAAR
jgi:murein L,D-transpeptidase YcbB/YkuD